MQCRSLVSGFICFGFEPLISILSAPRRESSHAQGHRFTRCAKDFAWAMGATPLILAVQAAGCMEALKIQRYWNAAGMVFFSLVILINFECLTGIRGFLTHSNLPVFPFKSTSFGFLDSWGFASNTNVAGRGTHNVKDPDEAGYGGVPQTWQSFWMSNAVVPPCRKCGKPKTIYTIRAYLLFI